MMFERLVAVQTVTSKAWTHKKKPNACTVMSSNWAYIIAMTTQNRAKFRKRSKIHGPSWSHFFIHARFWNDILSQCSYKVLGSASKAERTRKVFPDVSFLTDKETNDVNFLPALFILLLLVKSWPSVAPSAAFCHLLILTLPPPPPPPTPPPPPPTPLPTPTPPIECFLTDTSSAFATFSDGKPTKKDPNSMTLFQTVDGWGCGEKSVGDKSHIAAMKMIMYIGSDELEAVVAPELSPGIMTD